MGPVPRKGGCVFSGPYGRSHSPAPPATTAIGAARMRSHGPLPESLRVEADAVKRGGLRDRDTLTSSATPAPRSRIGSYDQFSTPDAFGSNANLFRQDTWLAGIR